MLKPENIVTVERERESYASNEVKFSFCFDAKNIKGRLFL